MERAKSDKEKSELSVIFISGAYSGLVDAELRDELIAAAFKILDGVPHRPLPMPPCIKCGGRMVYVDNSGSPKATTYKCDGCGNLETLGAAH